MVFLINLENLRQELENPSISLFGSPFHSSNGTLFYYKEGSRGYHYDSPIYTTEHIIYDSNRVKLIVLVTKEQEDYVQLVYEFVENYSQ